MRSQEPETRTILCPASFHSCTIFSKLFKPEILRISTLDSEPNTTLFITVHSTLYVGIYKHYFKMDFTAVPCMLFIIVLLCHGSPVRGSHSYTNPSGMTMGVMNIDSACATASSCSPKITRQSRRPLSAKCSAKDKEDSSGVPIWLSSPSTVTKSTTGQY